MKLLILAATLALSGCVVAPYPYRYVQPAGVYVEQTPMYAPVYTWDPVSVQWFFVVGGNRHYMGPHWRRH